LDDDGTWEPLALPFVIHGELGNTNIPAAPTNFTATPVGTQLKCNLSWTNPTTTYAGDPLTSITSVVIERNGTPIHTITSGITIGGTMSWQDATVPSAGSYTYSVYVVNSEGNGVKANAGPVIIGNVCNVAVNITSVTWGDGFSWKLTDDATGAMLIGGGLQATGSNVSTGTFTALTTGNTTFEIWHHNYSDNGVSLNITVDGEPIYQLTKTNISSGFYESAEVECSSPAVYNVYFNGELVGEGIIGNSYTHSGFDNTVENTWCVKVVCEDGNVSLPVCITKDPCIPCFPINNLTASYTDDCCAMLVWEAPAEKRKSVVAPIVPVVEDNTVTKGDKPQANTLAETLMANGVVLSGTLDDTPYVAPSKSSKNVIFDNGPMVTHPGAGPGGTDYSSLKPGQNILGTGMDYSSNYKLADDFTLDGTTTITEIDFYGIQQGSNTGSIFTAVYVEIYDGKPNAGGTVIWGDMVTNRLKSSSFSGIYRTNGPSSPSMVIPIMTVTANIGDLVLPAGTYWVAVSTSGAPLSIPYTYGNPVTVWDGNPVNPNGLKYQSGWANWLDDDGTWEPLALPFVIYGTGGGSYTYNIYRDGELIVENHPDLFYLDCGDFDTFAGHTWTITQVCQQAEFGESDPISVSLAACECYPPQNLIASYLPECEGVVLNWEAPDGSGKSAINPVTPIEGGTFTSRGGSSTDPSRNLAAGPNGTTIFTDPVTPFVPKGLGKGILYDNGPMVTHPGAGPGGTDYSSLKPGQNILGTGMDYNSNYKLADDFTLDAPSVINEIDFYGIQQGSNTGSVFTAVYVEIYDGKPNAGGTVIWGNMTTNRLKSSSFSGIYRTNGPSSPSMVIPIMTVTADIGGLVLPAGTYWVAVSTLGAPLSIPYTYGNPVTVWNGNPVNPNGLKYQSGWANWLDDDGTWEPLALPFVIHGELGNTNIPAAPTNFTATPVGKQLKCNLSWTNPTTTYAGAPLTNITSVVIERNGTKIHEITSGITVGGTMSWQDATIPTAGNYTYSVYAVNGEGNGVKANAGPVLIGDVCVVEVHISDVEYGDDFSWKIIDDETGATLIGAGGQVNGGDVIPGTFTALISGNATFTLWQHGTYYDNGISLTIKVNGVQVYALTIYNIPAGYNVSESMECETGGGTVYNIYYDGKLIEANWDDLTYIHYANDGMNPFFYHCWEVRAVCTGDGKAESEPITACLLACKDTTEYLVFGVVAAADGNFITGATLKLDNMHLEYNTQSVELGRFEFEGVYKTIYTLTVSKPGYQVHTQTVEVKGHTNLGTIILYDIPYPPTNVVAEIIDENSSFVHWQLPATLPVSVGGIVGYKVWRFLEADQEDQFKWHILTNNPVDAMEHTDFGWAGVAPGTYMYAVRTCYHGNVESEPAFSNTIEKAAPTYTVTFVVKDCELNGVLTDATIVFNGVTLDGYIAENVPAGNYPYTVSLENYETETGEVTVINQNVVVHVCLKLGIAEIPVGDFNLYPNPAQQYITVEREFATFATIELYNAVGAYINKYETTEAKFEINVATLSAGTYFIKVTEGDKVGTKTFVKR